MKVLGRVEERVRRLVLRALVRGSARAVAFDEATLRDRPLRVLFVAEDAVGDTILAMPAMRAIAESYPGTVVDVVTWAAPAELLRHAPWVRRTIVFPRYDRRRLAAWRAIRRAGPYDVVVDAMLFRRHVRSRTVAMMLASRAPCWLGEGQRGNDHVLNVVRPAVADSTLHLERVLSLVSPIAGDAAERRPELVLTEAEYAWAEAAWASDADGPRVLLNVSTNGPDRRWPAERFVALARHIRRRSPEARLMVVGLDRDRSLMERVAQAAAGDAQSSSLREQVALVAASDMVVSPDTAICHMASAFERPLASFHLAGMERFLPYDTPGMRVIGASRTSMEDISVRAVMRTVDEVLEQVRERSAWDGDRRLVAQSSGVPLC